MNIKSAREPDLVVELPEVLWVEVMERIHQGSSNARLELIQFKVMHILHYSIEKTINKLTNYILMLMLMLML